MFVAWGERHRSMNKSTAVDLEVRIQKLGGIAVSAEAICGTRMEGDRP